MLKATLTFSTTSEEEMNDIRNKIHTKLKGNEDYINSNIVLTTEDDLVVLYVFEECKTNLFKVLGV